MSPPTEESRCPNCGSLPGSDTTCVRCGHPLGAPDTLTPWEEELWELVARQDRSWFDLQEPDGLEFPDSKHTRRIELVGDHVSIGRRSKSRNSLPEIDLSGTLEDPCVSHHHAVLMRRPDGGWALVDQDSTNGTFVNADEEQIAPNEPLTLSDGDQVHVGRWTTLTIERVDPPDPRHSDQVSRPSVDTRNVVRGKRALEIDLLGPLRVRVRNEEVLIGASHKRAVLSLLALRVGTPVTADQLQWALWGDGETRTAATALRGYIKDLRKVVPEDVIKSVPEQGYRLDVHKDCIDVSRFERRCERGRRLLSSGHPGSAVALLDRALELWRGEPLVDLVAGPMGAGVAVGLAERKATAEEDRFEALLQLGEHRAIVADLLVAVEAEPLRERRWGQLMLALYRRGQQAEALRAFHRLYQMLKDEVGVEPSHELMDLERAIANNLPELAWVAPSQTGTVATPAV
ncbi:MAG TPA: BTAD domain-containing putative transcriptional regulator [Acidimicrobiales bacterium]|nr:BTAD domain-containing putative transcriptional regulator [Acidimicrobiales bacterium]